MAINPGIVQGLQPMRSPLEREQRLMSLKNARLGQEQEETALESAQLQNQGTRQKFNADRAIQELYKRNANPTEAELWGTGGPAATPYVNEQREKKRLELEQGKAQVERAMKQMEVADAAVVGLRQLPPEQRKSALEAMVQRWVQSGLATVEEGDDYLDDDLSNSGLDKIIFTSRARQMELDQAQQVIDTAIKNAPKNIDTYTNAEGRRTTMFQRPDGSTFEQVGGEVQKPQEREKSFEEQTYEDFKNDPDLSKQYGTSRIGFERWQRSLNQSGNKPTLTPTMEANIINRMQTSWDKATAPTRELERQIHLMDTGLAAARNGDLAQGAQAVLVTFQKILDPTSVVRESEYMRSAAGLSIMQRMGGALEQLAKGGAGVPLSELEKFSALAKEAIKGMDSHAKTVRSRVSAMAKRYGIPEELAFGIEGDGGGGPKVGDVQDGYQFLGGDPSDAKSWKKVP